MLGGSCETAYANNSVMLIAPNSPTITNVIPNNPNSCGGADGTIIITAMGGNGGMLRYSIDGGATYQFNNAFTGLTAGTYVIVTDNGTGGSCPAFGSPVVLEEGPVTAGDYSITSVNAGCEGSTMTFNLDNLTAIAYDSFDITPSLGVTLTNFSANNLAFQVVPLAEGQYDYFIKVWNANGCELSTTYSFTVNEGPNVQAQDYNRCLNGAGDYVIDPSFILVEGAPMPATATVEYTSTFGTFDDPTNPNATFTPFSNVTGPVIIVAAIDTGSGCPGLDAFTLTLIDTPAININDTIICPATSAILSASGGINYSWSVISGDVNSLNSMTSNTVVATPDSTTTYEISVTNLEGCISTTQVTVTVDVGCNNPPIAINDFNVTLVDEPVSGNVLTNDFELDGDNIILNLIPTMLPSNGGVVLLPGGAYNYTPNPGFVGTDVFEYEVCDDGIPTACDVATVTIVVLPAVTPTNLAPVAVDDNYIGYEGIAVTGNVLPNDFDPNSDSIFISAAPISNVTNGIVSIDATTGIFTYIPNAGFIGVDTFTYSICDVPANGASMCDEGMVIFTILENTNPPNLAPVAIEDANITYINTPVNGNVLPNDYDPNGNNISVNVTPVSPPSNGSVVINSDGSYTYTPNTGYVGQDQFIYRICDDGSPVLCDEATVVIAVLPINNAPYAIGDVNATAVNYPTIGNVLTNDFDLDGDNLVVTTTPVMSPSNGTVTINADGSYIYTPNTNFTGIEYFSYEVCDDGSPSLCDTAQVVINVFEIVIGNNPPVASNDNITAPTGTTVTGNVTNNDIDPDGDNLVVTTTPVTNPGNGTVTINTDGTFSYIPTNGFIGVDSFVYQVCDDVVPAMCSNATVILTITPPSPLPNNAPVAVGDIFNTPINTAITASVLPNDFDPDGDNIVVTTTPLTLPMSGTVVLNSDGTFTYTPNNGFVGNDFFVYEVCDIPAVGTTLCTQASVQISVTSTNTAPIAINDINTTLIGEPATGNVLTNDIDLEGGNLTVSTTPVVNPSNGTVTINTDGTYTYTPNPGFEGTETFGYEVCDDGTPALCDTAYVTINVFNVTPVPTNNTPVANNDNYTSPEGYPLTGNVLSNDFDADGDSLILNTTPIVNVTNGTVTINPDGSFVYVPTLGFNGVDSFVYEVCDASGACDQATVVIQTTPAAIDNQAPVAIDDANFTTVNTLVNGNVLGNDTDPDSNNLTVVTTPLVNVANGVLVLNLDGTYTYLPNPGFIGTDQFVYQVCDDGVPSKCDEATVYITIGSTNTPPIAINDINTVLVGQPATGNLLTNDIDLEGGNLTASTTPVVNPSNGTVTINTDGTYTYTPNPGFEGTETFGYQVCDDGIPSLCDTAYVTINVFNVNPVPTNNAPVANNDNYTSPEGYPLLGNVLSNDFDVDGDNLILNTTPVVDVTNGTVTINPDGSFVYVPTLGFNGVDSFVYEICDASGACDQATVVIQTTPAATDNQAPVAIDDANFTMINTLVNGNVLGNDTDPDTNNLTVTITPISDVSNGLLVLNPNGTYNYTPNTGFVGTDQFVYQICDDGVPSKCDEATVYITVSSTNVAPIAINDVNISINGLPATGTVLTNDTDPDGGNLTVSTTPLVNVTNGTLVLNTDGTYVYTPTPGFTGTETFTYQVCDDGVPSLCDTANVTIEVVIPTVDNDAPVAVNDNYTGPEGSIVTGSVLNNDFDPDGDILLLTATPIVNVTNGTLVFNTDGTFTYLPASGFNGVDSFVYQICDAGGLCDVATVTIQTTPIEPDNQSPVAVDDVASTTLNTLVNGNILGNDYDPDGNNLTVNTIPVVNPQNGIVTILPNGTYDYTPNTGFTGTDQFVYQICDDGTPSKCDVATVYISVSAPLNNAPIAINDINNTTLNTPVTGDVLTNDFDLDGDNLVASTTPVSSPTNGAVVLNTDGTYTYTPTMGYVGADFFYYEVCDDGTPSMCDTARVDIEVIHDDVDINDAPIANNDNYDAPVNTTIVGNVLNNDFDVDSDTITLTTVIITNTTNGTVTSFNADGSFVYEPNTDFIGLDSFIYQICDTNGLCDVATVYLLLTPEVTGNQAPIAVDDANSTTINTAVVGNVLPNDTDPDSNNLVVVTVLVSPAANGTVIINPDGSYIYTPVTGFAGPDNFVYQVCDDGVPSKCDVATVYITVFSSNNPPVAIDDINVGLINLPLDGNVLTNDTDEDGDNLTATVVTNPTVGNVTLDPNGSYTYTPPTGFTGTVVWTYATCDDGVPSYCDTANVTMNIIGTPDTMNRPPVANNDVFVTTVDNAITGASIISNDGDPDNDNITISTTPVTGVTNGIITINTNGTFDYTPVLGFVGTDEFTYEICDDGIPSLCDTATVTIDVVPDNGNLAPIANTDINYTAEGIAVTDNLLPNDYDPNVGDIITVNTTPVTPASSGTVTILPSGEFTYTPFVGFVGTDEFTYEICDNGTPSLCAIGTSIIVVQPLGECNIAQDTMVYASSDCNSPVGVCLPIAQSDIGDYQIYVDGQPYTDIIIGCDFDTITGYTTQFVTGTAPWTVTWTVNGSTFNGTVTSFADLVAQMNVWDNSANNWVLNNNVIEGGIMTNGYGDITMMTAISNSVLQPNLGITALGSALSVPFSTNTIEIIDTVNLCKDSIVIEAYCVPVDTAAITVEVGDSVNFCVSTAQLPGTIVSVTDICAGGDNTMYTVDAAGCLDINGLTPGTDTACIVVCDDLGLCDTTILIITVTPDFNNPPVAVDDNYTVDVGNTLIDDVSVNDSDLDNDPLTFTPITGTTQGTLTLNPDGTFEYIPNVTAFGLDFFDYEVCDNGNPALCDTARATIIVNINAPSCGILSDTISASTSDCVSGLDLCFPVNYNEIGNYQILVDGQVYTDIIFGCDFDKTYTYFLGFVTGGVNGTYNFDWNLNGSTQSATVTGFAAITDSMNTWDPQSNWTFDNVNMTIVGGELSGNSYGDIDLFHIATNSISNISPNDVNVALGSVINVPPTASQIVIFDTVNVCIDTAIIQTYCTPIDTFVVSVPVNDSLVYCVSTTDLPGTPVSIENVCPSASGTDATVTIDSATYCVTITGNTLGGVDTACIVICDDLGVCDTTILIIPVTPSVDTIYTTIPTDDTSVVCIPVDQLVGTTFTTIDLNCIAPVFGSVVSVSDTCITYDAGPTPGTDVICVVTVDSTGTPDTTIIIITVSDTLNMNVAPPIGINDINVTTVNIPVSGNVLTNDIDTDNEGLYAAQITTPTIHGTVTLDTNGTYIYIPNANFTGIDQFWYEVCDNGTPTLCDNALVTITVYDQDSDAPIAINDNGVTYENTPVTINVVSNDFDPNDDPIVITPTPITDPGNGIVSILPNGDVTYTPNTGYLGPDQFSYQICDTTGLCDTAFVMIEVLPSLIGNNPPVAIDDVNTTTENTQVSGDVLPNDSDPEGDNLRVTLVDDVNDGTLILNLDGTYTYFPDPGFIGTDQATYQICDDGSPVMCAMATLYLVVEPANTSPLAINDINNTLINTPVSGSLETNDIDFEGDSLIYTVIPVSGPNNGTIAINPDGSYTYSPNTSFVGVDITTYEVCDNGTPSLCDTATLTITILNPTPGNDAPTANDDVLLTVMDSTVIGNILNNDFDIDGDSIIINTIPVTDPTNGDVTIDPDGTVTYTPDSAFTGIDEFTYAICDTAGLCDTALVTIYVTPTNPALNDAPFAADDANITDVNVPVSGNVLPNDSDANGDNLIVNTTPIDTATNGTVELLPDGTYTYTPDSGFTGVDQFVYEVCDDAPASTGGSLCATATVYITVLPGNNPPVAILDINNTTINTPVNGNVLTNDFDTDGDNLIATTTVLVDPTNGTLTTIGGDDLLTDGSYTYEPNTDFVGVDSFQYVVCDDGIPSLCDTAWVYIHVAHDNLGSNDAPIANYDAFVTLQEVPVAGSLVNNDVDPDLDALVINTTPIDSTNNGELTINSDGTFNYTPDVGFTGTDEFIYEICDTVGLCDTALVQIVVLPATADNNAPSAGDDAGITYVNTPLIGNVLPNDSDPNGDNLILNTTPVVDPINGTVILDPATGNYVYTPDTGYSGPDQFVYEICDDGNPVMCDQATVYITVIPNNNPPIAILDINNTTINTPVNGNVLTNDFDTDGDSLIATTTVLVDPTNGTLTTPGGDDLLADGSYTYEPNTDFVGVDSFQYVICDDGIPSLCDTAWVYIHVAHDNLDSNDAPIANYDAFVTLQEVPVAGSLVNNDVDPDLDALVINTTPIDSTNNGELTINSDGTFNYTPDAGFTGTDEFIYEICDTVGLCDTALVQIVVLPATADNDAPSAGDDAGITYVNTPLNGNVLPNDSDPNGDNLILNTTPVVDPVNGTVTLDPATGNYVYTPDAGYSGPDQFVYEICDDGNPVMCDQATVYITVIPDPRNQAPIAVNDINSTLAGVAVSGTVITNDIEPNGDSLFVNPVVVQGPTNGTIAINPDGSYTYLPNTSPTVFTGLDSIIYEVCDNGSPALCDTATLYITVIDISNPDNNPPVANFDFYTGLENTPVLGDVRNNDYDPDGDATLIGATPIILPTNGTVVFMAGQGIFTYTPDTGFTGLDTFYYVICDMPTNGTMSLCDTGMVVIEIFPDVNGDDNDPPVAADDAYVTTINTPITSNVLPNDYDPNGDSLIVIHNTSCSMHQMVAVVNSSNRWIYLHTRLQCSLVMTSLFTKYVIMVVQLNVHKQRFTLQYYQNLMRTLTHSM